MSYRLLPSSTIPKTLWESRVLAIPGALISAYTNEVHRLDLYQLATDSNSSSGDHGPTGGMTQELTYKHFAYRFSGSCGRLELLILDPKEELANASDQIISAFAGGEIALLDIPCGAGAAALTLLSTIAELRHEGCLPRQPLDVHLVGGDLSDDALTIAKSMLDTLRPSLETQAIYVNAEWKKWNILDADSNTELLDQWISSGSKRRIYFIVAANFSAFLEKEGKLKNAKAQFDEIFRWASLRSSQVLWVEPQTNTSQSFFKNLLSKLKDSIEKFIRLLPDNEASPIPTTSSMMRHPLDVSRRFTVRAMVMFLRHSRGLL